MQGQAKQPLRIGKFLVEPDRNRISNGSGAVALRPQVMDLLIYLAGRPGEVVGGDEIIDRVWRGVTVTSSSVYNCITELRQALGDAKADPAYIETIPKRGYRLIAAVALAPAGGLAPAGDLAPAGRSLRRLGGTLLVAVLAGALLWAMQTGKISRNTGLAENSVAVLRFTNMSEEADREYLSDGMSEELTLALTRLPGLKVVARTSAFYFDGRPENIQSIGEALNVAHVVEGSVRSDGQRVRVTVQLIRTSDGFHVWSNAYDGDLDDFFDIQEEIARAVARAVAPEMAAPIDDLARAGTGNLEAYQEYLRGQYFWNLRGLLNVRRAVTSFTHAAEIDPNFARAYVGLANARLRLMLYDPLEPDVQRHMELARQSISRALEIDPDLGGAYTALSFANLLRLDFENVLPNSERAIRLSPNLPTAHHWYASQLMFFGRVDDSLRVMERALQLDPYSRVLNISYTSMLAEAGKLEEALVQAEKALTLAPSSSAAWGELWRIHLSLGDYGEARRALDRRAEVLTTADIAGPGWTDLIEKGAGDVAAAEAEADRLMKLDPKADKIEVKLLLLAGLQDMAVRRVEEVEASGRYAIMRVTRASVVARPLFRDRRFRDVLQRLGMVDYWRGHGWPQNCGPAGDADFRCGPLIK